MNWEDKASNIRSIAEELSIGLDSIVFFDDNSLHRASVRSFLPEVEVPELPEDPALYVRTLHALNYFPQTATTDEDALRGNLYVTERMRKAAEGAFSTKEAFLESLLLEAHIAINDVSAIPRIAQLTDKTNQFNTSKHPLSEQEVEDLMGSGNTSIYTMRVTDRFGDYGTIGIAIVHTAEEIWNVAQFLMSCRILGRGVEQALVSTIATDARSAGAAKLSFAYTPTEKNIPAKNFLDTLSAPPYHIDLTNPFEKTPAFISIITP
jgi:FkbH-like protein